MASSDRFAGWTTLPSVIAGFAGPLGVSALDWAVVAGASARSPKNDAIANTRFMS
jgi:hypothetical protein